MKSFVKIAIFLSVILLMALMTTAVLAAEVPDAVVYVDALNGDDGNDGLTEATAVKDIKAAYAALATAMEAKGLKTSASATGKIIFVNDYIFNTFTSSAYSKDIAAATHTYRVILEGKTPQVSFQFVTVKQSFLGLMGPTTIQNLNVRLADNAENKYLSIHGRGGKFIIGEGVSSSDDPDKMIMLSAGPYFATSISTSLEINSGDWRAAYAGCYHRALTGNATLVINGGNTAIVCGVYNNKITGNVDITINGGTVGSVNMVSSTSGSVSGTAIVNFNGGTLTGNISSTGTVGEMRVNVTGNDAKFTYNGTLSLNSITASKLFLGSNTRVVFSEAVTGPVAVTVDKAVRYNVPYVTAPSSTSDNAFTFAQKTMTATVSGSTKSWLNTDESNFTGLVLKAPKEFTVKLYTGTKDGSLVTPDKTETIDGIKYQYYVNIMGDYRYVTSRSGYYTLTKAVWMSEEKSLAKTVIDASSGKKDGIGWEPSTVKDYSDECHENIIPEDEKALWWNDYSPLLVSPYFTTTHAEHRATTQDEMESFLASLDDANDNMYIYSLGKSAVYGMDIPIVIFTKVDLSGAKTLEEAASLIRADNKLVIHYQAQIHGNEPAGGEAALNTIARLDGDWGNGLLDTINCYVIPRLNPDGSKDYTRANAMGVNVNRDMVLATTSESAAIRRACDLFEPDVNLDGHEYTYTPQNTYGTYVDLMCSSGINGNYSEAYIEINEIIARNHYQKFYDYGMQPGYYTNKANSYSAATNSGYHSTRGALHFLMESRGIGGGNYNMTRRIVAHMIVTESIFEYAAQNHKAITSLVDAERERFARLGATYEQEDVILLKFKETLLEEYAHLMTNWNCVSGKATSVTNKVPIFYREAQEGKTRVRPTAYVFPDGEAWTQDVLDCLDANGLKYYNVPAGTMLQLRQMIGVIDAADMGAEAYYGFENGCYVVPMNQYRCLLISYIFEADICGYSPDEGYGSLTQMSVIPSLDNCFPVYYYVHDLEADGTVATYTAAPAPIGLYTIAPSYVGGTGSIAGLDPNRTYAYRSSKSAEYTVVSGVTAIENLSVGKWLVRYADVDAACADAVFEFSYGDIKEIVVYVDQTVGADTNDGFTEEKPVATIEAAIAALADMANENIACKVVFLSDYTLGTSAYTFPSHSFPVTYTGKTADIAIIKTGGTSQDGAVVALAGPSTFEYITIQNSTTSSYNNFCCNGYKTVFGLGVTCTPNAKGKNYMLSAGGYSTARNCTSTDLTVLSGDWNMIYAGGYIGSVKGDAKLTVRNANVVGQIMGAYSGAITGSITYDIANTTANGIYLGLAKTNSVGGDITATIGEGTDVSFLYAGNRDSGNVTGTVHVIVQGADLSDAALYGTCKTSGTVGKSILTNRGSTLGTVTGFTEMNTQSYTGIYYICKGDEVIQTCYTFAEAAAAAGEGTYIRLGSDATDTATVTGDVYVDLNGFDLSGITVTGTFYGMDSTTDGYSCDKVGTLTLQSGTVAVHFKSAVTGSVKRYMAIETEGSYTFHRFYLAVTHLTVRPDTAGVGYKAVFYGDDMVIAKLQGFGFNMQLGENTPKQVTGSTIVSGKTVTLRIDNYDVEKYGETPLKAAAVLVLHDGTVIESTVCTTTFRSVVESINANYMAFTTEQLALLKTWLQKYAIVKDWAAENLLK